MALTRVGEIAQVIDGASEDRLRIRLDDQPGIKLAVQKQPQSNTVAVVDAVDRELQRLSEQGQLPKTSASNASTTRHATSAIRSPTR
jgi:multidrug efflux pump subunit AcrB